MIAPQSAWHRTRESGAVRTALALLALLAGIALFAPLLGSVDPTLFDAASGNLAPGARGAIATAEGATLPHLFLMGSDALGRDLYSRVLYGTRVSLVVGIAVALIALACGIACGLLAGYLRGLDAPLMRLMDALMAIPSILVALLLVALWRPGLATLIAAIALTEIPRVARLARALVLTLREEPYVEAALALGAPAWKIMLQHILPNAAAPLLVQGSYVCASAMLAEAILSFLGVGLPPEVPSWGGIMAEARVNFGTAPHSLFFPGAFLALSVFAVNLLGDGLRAALDPKTARAL